MVSTIGYAVTHPAYGVAHYRAHQPTHLLHLAGRTVCSSEELKVTPAGTFALAVGQREDGAQAAAEPDVVVITGAWCQGLADAGYDPAAEIHGARAEGQRIVVDIDDLPWIPADNAHFRPDLAHLRLSAAMAADAVTVSTNYLAGRLRSRGCQVELVRNYVDPADYDCAFVANLPAMRPRGGPLVIGWRGGTRFHAGDLATMRGILGPMAAAGLVRFVHVGHDPGAPAFADLVGVDPTPHHAGGASSVECRPMVPMADYPELLAGVDLAIVPLRDGPFNEAKSAVAGLEWNAAGVPWIASPAADYVELGDGRYLADSAKRWARLIGAMADPDTRYLTWTQQRREAARYNDPARTLAALERALDA